MNIFVLDTNPKLAAQYHCDKHVISQMKESVQMLCTALMYYGNPVPINASGSEYKEAYPNHPCTKWVIEGLLNYQWLWDLTMALVEEAEFRFGGEYHIASLLRSGELPRTPEKYHQPPTRTPFANATADWLKSGANWDVPASFTTLTIVDVYRLYYIVDKRHMTDVWFEELNIHYKDAHKLGKVQWDAYSIWTKRGEPPFMGDRFYRQMCDHFGIKSAELLNLARHPDSEEAIKLRAKLEKKMGVKKSGTATSAPKKKATKADYLLEIRDMFGLSDGLDDLLKLTAEDLVKLRMFLPSLVEQEVVIEMPSGRLKKPYIDAISSQLTCDVDWNKLTIVGLKQLIELFS
ncbi:hypothetical protein [Vibrio phage JSF12]|uniref:Uncharacterized protein n=3 Tax=Jesfedecavirus TaxID=2560156 RepID=A0A2D0YNC9_9CAUD|nr:DNA binding protein [Vibrio phage phi 3]YP_009618399.1 DNA binding protein [Vibrio phage JSF10]YP_009794741.1 DNA binding protein [Vibrio phage JSF12]AJF40811.1 hypothetical protein SBVP3_0043 [Vibrio phage phi 3]ASV43372.1 hypothetical protein [Vibrio phage JSF10]ASV43576.1 hypothetical protein [Vibrio phage JSF12]